MLALPKMVTTQMMALISFSDCYRVFVVQLIN